jgi:hypothetical protein
MNNIFWDIENDQWEITSQFIKNEWLNGDYDKHITIPIGTFVYPILLEIENKTKEIPRYYISKNRQNRQTVKHIIISPHTHRHIVILANRRTYVISDREPAILPLSPTWYYKSVHNGIIWPSIPCDLNYDNTIDLARRQAP